ncbi:hypothetical protein MBLNU13_g09888t3 [Cladosporium sp. NU13]
MNDVTTSILKYKGTLRNLQIDGIQWADGAPSALGWFYSELSKAPQLEEIEQQTYFFTADPNGNLGIPKHLSQPWFENEEDEHGFIWVYRSDIDIHYRGKDQVKQVLEECAASM